MRISCRREYLPSCCAIRPMSAQFDASFFEYSPEEARLMVPQRQLLLEGEAPSDASDKDFNRGHRERYWGLPKSGEFGASCGDDILDILADLMTVL
jgi:hypothetical protein